jgi:UDP-2-acetamido-2-deoxy-ribo-hexuluronate aminotransferase
MEFVDLKKQYELSKASIDGRIEAVLRHGQFIMGPEVEELEDRLARFTGARHCVSCGSGTDALLMLLLARGVGPGDAVFTTPFTFIATAEVISLVGATPVFVDVDPHTFNLSPERLADAVAAVASGTRPSPGSPDHLVPRAVIPVDIFGLPAAYDAIAAIARQHSLFVIEDAAQSLGALYHGRRAGALGHAAATSFFPAKPLGCYGDGGAIFTDDDALADVLRSIRIHGKGDDKYDNVRIGMNGRLDTLQAAVLLAKLDLFPRELEQRQTVASAYRAALGGLVETQHIPEGLVSAWAQFSVLSPRRAELQGRLKAAGVPTAVYYPKPLHLQTAFAPLRYARGSFPASELLSERIFSLPIHPYLDTASQERITEVIRAASSLQTEEHQSGPK